MREPNNAKFILKTQTLNLLVGAKIAKTILDPSTTKFGSINLNFLTNSRNNISFNSVRTNRAQQPKVSNSKNTRQPIFYVDTNIMMDASKNRNADSISLISIIDKNKWECITSAFAFMEMIDIEQDDEFVKTQHRAGADYSKICRSRYCRNMTLPSLQNAESTFISFHQQYPFIRPASLDERGWDLALHITSSSNIFAPDAIHLATAWIYGCDLLVTNDSSFIKGSKELLKRENVSCFDVCTAKIFESTLQKIGFEVTI